MQSETVMKFFDIMNESICGKLQGSYKTIGYISFNISFSSLKFQLY